MNNNLTIDFIKEKVKVLKDNHVYRVADVSNFAKNHKVVIELLNNPKYKGTLLQQYHKENEKDFFQVLLKNKNKIKYYNDDYILVHLRTGDDIKERGIERNTESLLEQLKKFDKSKKVIIVTAMHYGHHRTDHRFYNGKQFIYTDESYSKNLKIIHNFIKKLEHKVENILSNENVDIDLLHLVFCQNLVASNNAGGFARKIIEWHKKYLELEKK